MASFGSMAQRFVVIAVLLSISILSACQLDASRYRPVAARPTEIVTPTLGADRLPTFTATSTSAATPTPSATVTPTPTPTVTPTPTATPIHTKRLSLARRAYDNGDYETARREFDTLLADPDATPNEQRLALHWRGRSELQVGDSTAAIVSLTAFLQQYPSDELSRAAQFNLAVAYEQAGQFEEAIQAYRGSIIPEDSINSYIYERIGDLALSTGAYTDTIAAYQSGVASTDDPGFQVHLREGIAEAELRRGFPAAAINQYELILGVSKIDSYRAKILRLAGEAYVADDDPEAAYERYLEAVNRYPEAYDSYLALVELIDAEVAVDEFQRGLVDYHAGAYDQAIAAFERYLNSAPTLTPTLVAPAPMSSTTNLTASATITPTPAPVRARPTPLPFIEDAMWYTAQAQQALGQHFAAINSFRKFIDQYPDSPNWGEAHLEIGRTYFDLDAINQAKVTFRDFAAQNPNHPLAGEALWRAARLELDGDLLAEAQTSLNELAETYPNNDYADDALYWAGQAAFKLSDYEAAVEAWDNLADNYADSELANPGSYWQAKALIALDRSDEAEAVLAQLSRRRLDYYGLRAEELLADRQARSVPLSLPTQAAIAQEQAEAEAWLAAWLDLTNAGNISDLSAEIRSDPAFGRGQALLEIGLRDEALVEFETVKDNWWNNALAMYQLAVYFRDKGLGRLSILTAARLVFLSPAGVPEDAPIFVQRLYYPIHFEDVVFAEAAKYGLDPALVLAIMRQESLFERSAHSRAGARGLMQIMPATGEYVVDRAGFGSYDPGQLWLPFLNIRYGTWYINQQLGIFDDNQFAALAAYNAGPGNVLQWLRSFDDLDTFVEAIPFFESRLYIKTIFVNLAAYRRLYGVPTDAAPNGSP